MNESPTPIEELTYEHAYKELEVIVADLETEEHSLDDSLALFERGQSLAKHCADLLEKAELRVQQISGEELIPFELE